MGSPLSPYRLVKARDTFNTYNVLNTISWNFLVGNVITLFALRLSASSTYIGLLNAVLYVAFLCLPLGKLFTKRFSIIKVFSTAWIIRAFGMIPVLIAPFLAYAGKESTALGMVLLGVTIFHVTRGIGLVGNNPVINLLATGPDRGSYLTQIQIVGNAVGMCAGFVIAMLLGRDPPLFIYSIIFAVGIGTGIASGVSLGKVPDPGIEESNGKRIKFADILKQAFSTDSIRHFIIILFLVALVSGVARVFIVVYSREVFSQTDGMVSLFAVFAGLGVLMIGLLVKFLVDRIGAKPIFIVCVMIGVLSLLPVIIVSPSMNEGTVFLYLVFLFFIMNFGFCGAEGIAQTYFFGLIPKELMLDMGIIYFLCFGIAGTAGSFLGGLFLDILKLIGLAPVWSFRVLYILLFGLGVVILILQRKMVPLGALPFKDAIEIMFSPRDLRAISIMEKLNKASGSLEEEALLGELHGTPSKLSIKGLLVRAKSPRLTVRVEALRAIGALENLNEDAEKALMEDITHNPYTTAYTSARILGSHNVTTAIPLLRELVSSDDYMLAGESFIALARLGDEVSRPQIEEIIMETQNPRLKIMGVEALGISRSPNSLTVLLDILRGQNPPPYLLDEVLTAMANILDTQNQFYPILVRFLADETQAPMLAMDEVESAYENYFSALGRKRAKKDAELAELQKQAKVFQSAAASYIKESKGADLSRWIMGLPDTLCHTIVQVILSEATLDNELKDFPRLKLLIINWAAHVLRVWTNRVKRK